MNRTGCASAALVLAAILLSSGPLAQGQIAELRAADGKARDSFGMSVSISADGRYAAIGETGGDHESKRSGSDSVFQRPGGPPPHAPYVVTLGEAGFDTGTDVGVDGAGNAYFIGEFDGSFDFDPGAGTRTLSSTQRDVYVTSYGPGGEFRFAFQIGNPFPVSELAGGIAVSESGHFVITGPLPFHDVDFDPDPTFEMREEGVLYVAGYDFGGGLRFVSAALGLDAASSASSHDVAIGQTNRVYVVGRFSGVVDFAGGPVGAKSAPAAEADRILTSAGSYDGFLAGYTSTGSFEFAIPLGGAETDVASGVAVDRAENLYAAGHFRGSVPFDPRDSRGNGHLETRRSGPLSSAFLASYASDGTFRYAYAMGDDARGEALGVDAAGNVYLTGTFAGTIRYDPEDRDGNGDLGERTVQSGSASFLASYRSDGTLRFVLVLEGVSAHGLTTLRNGDSYLTGSFGGVVDFDPGSGVHELRGEGGRDVFVARYDSLGRFLGAFSLEGSGLDKGSGIAVDHEGNVLLTGEFTGNTDFDPGPGALWRAGGGQNDAFMAKFLRASMSVGTDDAPEIAEATILSPAFPNPFARQTRLRLTVPAPQRVRVVAYDLLGRQIAILYEGREHPAVPREVEWSAADLPSGTYLIRAEGETFERTQRVVVVR